jgi:hypothetical protein
VGERLTVLVVAYSSSGNGHRDWVSVGSVDVLAGCRGRDQ